MALHRKLDALDTIDADVAVLSEIARPDVIARKANDFDPSSCTWDGHNRNKGLGIVTGGDWSVQVDDSYDPDNQIVMPVRVRGPINFNLLAVWSLHVAGKRATHKVAGPVVRAIEVTSEFCREAPLVVAGDFNNNVIWDSPGNMNNMAAIDEMLREFGVVSAYHHSRQAAFGKESDPTIYWRDRRIDGPTYHIDYIYIPEQWAALQYDFQVGRFEDWVGNGLSDHVPLTLSFDIDDVKAAQPSRP